MNYLIAVVALVVIVSGCTAAPATPAMTEPLTPATQPVHKSQAEPHSNTTEPEIAVNTTVHERATKNSVPVTLKLREKKNVTLAGVTHTVTYLGSDSALEAAIHINFYGNNFLKGRQLNFSTNGRKLGLLFTNVSFGAIATDMEATFTLTDLGPA